MESEQIKILSAINNNLERIARIADTLEAIGNDYREINETLKSCVTTSKAGKKFCITGDVTSTTY